MTIVVIGEILWDVFEDSEKLGGAPFNFAVHAARLGYRVVFLSAVGDDERGRKARDCAEELGLSPAFIQVVKGAPTGVVDVRVDAAGQPDFTIRRPAAYDSLKLDGAFLNHLGVTQPDWIYFGTLHQANAAGRLQTQRLIDAFPNARTFYDVNLRRDSYTPVLVLELLAQADVVKLNESEAGRLDEIVDTSHRSAGSFTADWSRRLGWEAVAVTRGAQGSVVRVGDHFADVPGYAVPVADTVGAGDAFAAAFLHGLAQNWGAERTADFANRVGALVASRPGGVPPWTPEEALDLRRA